MDGIQPAALVLPSPRACPPPTATAVTQEHLNAEMPPHSILEAWKRGEDPEFPVPEPPPSAEYEPLRFKVGDAVEVRLGDGLFHDGVIRQCW